MGGANIVAHPRINHLAGCASPRKKPRPKKQIAVGKKARFSTAVAKTGNKEVGYVDLIPLGITYGGTMIQHNPPIAAKKHQKKTRLLIFISLNSLARLGEGEAQFAVRAGKHSMLKHLKSPAFSQSKAA